MRESPAHDLLALALPLPSPRPCSRFAEAEPDALEPILRRRCSRPRSRCTSCAQHIVARVPKPPAPRSAAEWTEAAKALRQKLLSDVVFHGWPAEWVSAPPRFEETGVIEAAGYRIRKLRYEIVPGFFSAALLYEPTAPPPAAPRS